MCVLRENRNSGDSEEAKLVTNSENEKSLISISQTLTMSIEIPHDLIKQVHAAVLREVNLSSYDPNDSSLPKQLPSIESSISELDPSPPHLRCKHCNGRLLRGTQSLLCVFCGKQIAQKDSPPKPIHFKTTFGCSWLLNSLNFDGSEIVGLPVKPNESNRGRIATEEEVRLADFLDLEVTWNSKLETLGIESDKGSFSLVGVDFDKFLGERKLDTVSAVLEEPSQSQEKAKAKANESDDDSGSNDFQVHDNFSSLGKVERFETAVRSTEEDKSGGDSYTGWEASFQSAVSKTSNEESKLVDPVVESSINLSEDSKSVDPVVKSSADLFEESKLVEPVLGSSVDLSAHMDAVFGSGNSLLDGKEKENVVSSSSNISDWFHDEVIANVKDGGTAEIANSTSSMSIDWIHDDQLQIKSDKAPNNENVDKEDESFNAWNDFTSSTSGENPSNKQNDRAMQFEVTAVVEDSGKVENTSYYSSTSIDNKAVDSKVLEEEDNQFDAWNDFASSTSTKDPSSGPSGPAKQFEWNANVRDGKTEEYANSSSFMNVDCFQDNQWQTNGNKATNSKTIEINDDLFDAWNDFTSLSAAQDSSKKQIDQAKQFEVATAIKDNEMVENVNNSASILWTRDDQWSTDTNKTPDSKTIDDRNDLFDTWNDFTSSSNALDSLHKQTGQAKQFEMTENVKDRGIMGANDSSFDWFQGNQLQTSSTTTPDKKTIDEVYDPFDAWNDFTSSSTAQDLSNKQSVNHTMPSIDQTAKNNLQDFDFGGFSQPRVFPGSLKDQNGSTEVNIMMSEPSVSDRISDVNAKGGKAGEAAKGYDVPTSTARSTTDNVEMLISQMHDLSFMRESNLSIPQKQDDFHSFSKG